MCEFSKDVRLGVTVSIEQHTYMLCPDLGILGCRLGVHADQRVQGCFCVSMIGIVQRASDGLLYLYQEPFTTALDLSLAKDRTQSDRLTTGRTPARHFLCDTVMSTYAELHSPCESQVERGHPMTFEVIAVVISEVLYGCLIMLPGGINGLTEPYTWDR